jgi:DNA-binding LacI/PurR family transcriptional regulator
MSTIKEVAARAGVSPSTVSNVFLGRVPVKERTKRRVLSAAQHLGYQPDGLAQALRTGRTRTLGLCVPFVTNPTIAAIVNGATRAAQEAGYAVSVCAIENDPHLQETYLDLLRRERVAAVISQPASSDPLPYAMLKRGGTALIFVDRRPADVEADFLTPDYRGAMREAVLHLFARGRRRIALVAGPRWIDSSRERIAGYEDAHREAALSGLFGSSISGVSHPSARASSSGAVIDEDLLVTPERRHGKTPREAIAELLQRPAGSRPDAVVAGSADVTLTALACLKELGVAVPQEVALIGTGQVDWAALASPPLTMIEIDGDALGRQAVHLALSRIAETAEEIPASPPRELRLPARFVVRESSG